MLRIRIIGLSLIAMFAVSAIAAAGASAAVPLWRINGAALTKAETVASDGTLELTDLKGGVFGEASTVKGCTGKDTGTVGPRSEDLITTVTGLAGELTVKCASATGGCEKPEAMALHLPWKTELLLVGTEVRDRLLSDGAGEPGWEVKCQSIIGEITDKCEGATSTGIQNISTGVEAIFDAVSKTTPANCSRGGNGTGLVSGKVTILSPASGTLTALE